MPTRTSACAAPEHSLLPIPAERYMRLEQSREGEALGLASVEYALLQIRRQERKPDQATLMGRGGCDLDPRQATGIPRDHGMGRAQGPHQGRIGARPVL